MDKYNCKTLLVISKFVRDSSNVCCEVIAKPNMGVRGAVVCFYLMCMLLHGTQELNPIHTHQSLLKRTLVLICSRMLWMLAYPLSPLRETRGFGCCGVYGYTKRMFQGLLKGTLEPNTHLPASTAWDSGANDLALSTDNFTRVKQNGSVYFKNI